MIKIVLPGEPTSKDRPRFSKFGTYDPQKAQKNACKWQILDQLKNYSNLPFSDHVPIEIEMIFYFRIPTGKENLFDWGLLEHTNKPDYDNCEKFILDVLSKIVYSDDRQVILSNTRKEYSKSPRTEINIMPKKPECSDQVKEVLAMLPTETFVDIATQLSNIVELDMAHTNPYHFTKSISTDYEEIAYCILEFAEKHADNLKKINKKFPGLAKILKEKMEQK
jgi:Holliday junction resolvase RusA-like endonuclease